ncbi:MAG: nodulation protein NfeD [Chloroflexota bacterium]|nr:nodulation protein NfeD [Chloroflexota bacterium]
MNSHPLLTPIRRLAFVGSLLALLLLANSQVQASIPIHFAPADGPVVTVQLDGFIDPNAARYVARAIDEATEAEAELLVVKLNTPGGLSASAREIVSSILESPVLVAVLVTPRGAQAASAGMFILAAANIAAMSPGTNVGAASPIDATGQDVPETLAAKVLQDTQAFARSIAEARGRDPAPLEAAITESRSYSAVEAINLGIADVLAADLRDLLHEIRELPGLTGSENRYLDLLDAPVQPIERTLLEHFLSVVATPNLAFILLTVGGIALLIELSNPGLVVPGVTGAIALGLGFVGLGQLPVNWLGVALLLIALGLLFLEFQEPGAGVYGAGAGVSFIVAAILLAGGALRPVELDFPGAETFTVSVWVIAAMGAILAALTVTLIVMAKTGKPVPYRSPFDRRSMVGNRAHVTRRLAPDGEVQMLGEFWHARVDTSDEPDAAIEEGYAVEVTAVDGTTLTVRPAADQPDPDRPGATQPPSSA